jgi:hypothetical protein
VRIRPRYPGLRFNRSGILIRLEVLPLRSVSGIFVFVSHPMSTSEYREWSSNYAQGSTEEMEVHLRSEPESDLTKLLVYIAIQGTREVKQDSKAHGAHPGQMWWVYLSIRSSRSTRGAAIVRCFGYFCFRSMSTSKFLKWSMNYVGAEEMEVQP